MKNRGLILAAALACTGACAVDVNVIGLFPGKAVITVNRGAPRTLSVGDKTAEGVVLISTDSKGAIFEIDGKRETLEMGQHFESAAQTGARQSVTLGPDERGHYIVDGMINGGYMRFIVDTGATTISMTAADATRLGIDYRRGRPGQSVVADGRRMAVYRVTLDSVTIGDITIFNVEASVSESVGIGGALLGNSFLNRVEMRREGQNLTLTKRY
jgi:aspartyl protease family protein